MTNTLNLPSFYCILDVLAPFLLDSAILHSSQHMSNGLVVITLQYSVLNKLVLGSNVIRI
jgi:hypothetical protein